MILSAFGLESYAPIATWIVVLLMLPAYASERYRPEIVAVSGMALLLLLGPLKVSDMLLSMSNSAPWTIVAMFILSGALVRTGLLSELSGQLSRLARFGKVPAVAAFIAVTIFASAFVNNTPMVVVMIPITFALSRNLGIAPSRLLMPLSFAAILGGLCTLIGTSTNLVIDGVFRSSGFDGFSMFEITPVGICLALIGSIYMAVAFRFFLPARQPDIDAVTARRRDQFLVEVFVPHDSPAIGKAPADVTLFRGDDRSVLDVIRAGSSLRGRLDSLRLEAGDVVVLRSAIANVLSFRDDKEVKLSEAEEVEAMAARNSVVREILLTPGARLIGTTLGRSRLRRRYGVYPFALHRHGEQISTRLDQVTLQVGDTLLVEGAPEDILRLSDDLSLLSILEPEERAFRRSKSGLAVLALLLVVAGNALGIMPIVGLAWIGVSFVFLTRCIDADEAVRSVDWSIVIMIFAMLAVGRALETTGAVRLLVEPSVPFLTTLPPIVLLGIVYAISSVLTEFVTNNAVAVIVTPVVIGLAVTLGLDPRPFAATVMFAASASFATPIGYQTNTLVFSAGGYKFADFLRLGLPLNIICGIATVLLVPLVWPIS